MDEEEEEYRRNEAEARRIAEGQRDEEHRRLWLRLADWWKDLKERAAKSRK